MFPTREAEEWFSKVCKSFRLSRRFRKCESFSLACVDEVDAAEDHRELRRREREIAACGDRDREGSALQSLHEDEEAIAVPGQDFQVISSFVDEHEVIAGERIATQLLRASIGSMAK